MTPSIGFVVATLNEEDHVAACLASLLAQDYPPDLIQVAVVDGGSTDRTRAVVEAIAAEDARVELLENPRRIAAAAFNIGIGATTADIVSLVSAHSALDLGYARTLAAAFEHSGATLVGGRMVAEPTGADPTADAIRRATSSPFGLGNATFHFGEDAGWVDTAFPGAYRRSLLEELGGFDEALVRNQDDDLHFRAAQRGHRMWFDPALRSYYRPRTTLRGVWDQYFDYGVWRAATLRKHHRFAAARHAAPPLLVLGLVTPIPLLWLTPVRWLWGAEIVAYCGFVAVGALRERVPLPVQVRVACAIAALHIAYGSGFWVGLVRGGLRG